MWRVRPQENKLSEVEEEQEVSEEKQEIPEENFAKNLTCYYCGKKGHIERDCFKRKRDAEQGIVKPVSKNIEKQEQTETAYGLITTNVREETQTCSNCVYERQEAKGCYVQPKEKFCITETTEEKEVNTNQEET